MKKALLVIFPFLLGVCILGFVVSGEPQETISRTLAFLENVAGPDGGTWVSLSNYFQTNFLPAWQAISNPSGLWDVVRGLFGLLFAPISFIVFAVVDVFYIISTTISFLFVY